MEIVSPRQGDQHEKLFMTRVRVGEHLCDVIIDSGSCTNVVSNLMIRRLNHPTLDHPSPYKLHWLYNTSNVEVTKQALISFKLGPIEDQVLCDVCPMDACHILLGRPWQYDRFAKYHRHTNEWRIRTHEGGRLNIPESLKGTDLKRKATIVHKKGVLLTSEKEVEK